MANSTIINGTQLIKDNMPVQPENIIIIIAVFFFLALVVGGGFWIWTKMNG
jgi:hypothetical protein